MKSWLRNTLGVSEQGADGLIKGSLYNLLYQMSIVLSLNVLAQFLMVGIESLLHKQPFHMETSRVVIGIVVPVILMGIFYYIQFNYVFISTYEESEQKRLNLGEKLRKLPLSFFNKKDLTELTSTIMSDCSAVEEMLSHALPQLIASILMVLIMSIPLLMSNFIMGVAMLWVIPITFFIMFSSAKTQLKSLRGHFDAKNNVSELMQQDLEHISDYVSYGCKDQYFNRFQKALVISEKNQIKSELTMAVFVTGCQGFFKLGMMTTILTGLLLWQSNNISSVMFVMYVILANRIYDPIAASMMNISHVLSVMAPIDRMQQLEQTKEMGGETSVEFNRFDISFHHVDFGYGEDLVLHDVSFIAKQGEITALIGPSGSGKSTISKLVARFYDVSKGTVCVGGIDIKTIDPQCLLSNISMVFQEVLLFDESVFANIKIGRSSASDEEVYEAARMAHCDEFVKRLPEGYDSKIGENGILLSGGERQRISIARALLKNAPIVLLDEATASLDVESESFVQQALQQLLKGKTVLVIAHRMRTIEKADYIIGLKEGEIAEEGNPEYLLSKKGMFYRMMELQKQSKDTNLLR